MHSFFPLPQVIFWLGTSTTSIFLKCFCGWVPQLPQNFSWLGTSTTSIFLIFFCGWVPQNFACSNFSIVDIPPDLGDIPQLPQFSWLGTSTTSNFFLAGYLNYLNFSNFSFWLGTSTTSNLKFGWVPQLPQS